MLTLKFSGAIASAVAGEVTRLEAHPEFFTSEGAAYKAAWDRAGSNALNHCEAFRRDCLLTSLIVHPARPPLIELIAQRTAIQDAALLNARAFESLAAFRAAGKLAGVLV